MALELQSEASVAPMALPETGLVSGAHDVILDITVELSLEVGRTTTNVGALLAMNVGTVIELDRPAGEPLDVYVNGRLVAHGEVVMVNERYGVRFTDSVSTNRSRR